MISSKFKFRWRWGYGFMIGIAVFIAGYFVPPPHQIWFIVAGVIITTVTRGIMDHIGSPHCKWCNGRHFGRCMWNPRSGRWFSNEKDGYYDYNDPNK